MWGVLDSIRPKNDSIMVPLSGLCWYLRECGSSNGKEHAARSGNRACKALYRDDYQSFGPRFRAYLWYRVPQIDLKKL